MNFLNEFRELFDQGSSLLARNKDFTKRHVADKIFAKKTRKWKWTAKDLTLEERVAATAVGDYESQNENWYRHENEEEKINKKTNY